MRITGAICLLVFALMTAGCGSQKRMVNRYYLIETPEDSSKFTLEDHKRIESYCEIDPVDVYPAYASEKVALRTNTYEIIYYSYHQWAVRPSETLTRIIVDYLDHNGIFKDVSTRFWKVNPAFRITATIYQLEILQQNNQFSAHLDCEFRLENIETREVVVIHRKDRYEPLPSRDLNWFAKTTGEIFYEELHGFTLKMLDQKIEQ